MSDINEMNEGLRWYVAHTYSGYENKVKTNLEKIIENALGKASENCITKLNALLEGIATEETDETNTPITTELIIRI